MRQRESDQEGELENRLREKRLRLVDLGGGRCRQKRKRAESVLGRTTDATLREIRIKR